jgi:hypothetical protein
MSLVYPQPAFSTSGAIVATTLSRAGPQSGDTALRATFDNSANALLCHLRGADQESTDEDWAKLVALVPSHSADEYNRGSDMGIEECAHNPLAGRAALTAVSSVDLPTLDYPFVEIDWSEDPARREALDAFATWLAHNKLFEPAGEGPQPSSPARISADAARPGHRVDLQVMIDGSGSMARSPTASASALHDALAEVRQILTDTDQVSAGKFFADDSGTAKAPMAREGDAGGGRIWRDPAMDRGRQAVGFRRADLRSDQRIEPPGELARRHHRRGPLQRRTRPGERRTVHQTRTGKSRGRIEPLHPHLRGEVPGRS